MVAVVLTLLALVARDLSRRTKMADKKEKSEELLLPPLKDSSRKNKSDSLGKKFGNFGSYVLLPAVDPLQNINTFYRVRKICKLVCEWYTAWRTWQKEVLLCSLSAKCSVSQLSSLSTILEPVFHRDFVSRLHGRYPVKDLKDKSLHKKKKWSKTGKRIRDKKKENVDEKDRGIEFVNQESRASSVPKVTQTTTTPTESSEACETCETGEIIMSNKPEILVPNDLDEGGSDMQELIKDKPEVEKNSSQRSVLTDMVKQNLTTECLYHNENTDRQCQSEELRRPLQEGIAGRLISTAPDNVCQRNLQHRHMSDVYKKETDRQFFSASRLRKLADMKANLPNSSRYQLERHASDLDQKCYKHTRWWSDVTQSKRLVPASHLKLWNHFTRQLREINERMDEWGDHDRVNLLSEVIKSSDPEQINFFAQCLIQRLRDRTDVRILPDQTILKIFSKLDAKVLCQVSQVCRRWRYLGEDANLWRQKCCELGLCKGIKNLIILIETSACNHHIDWKQAYQDVYKIFQEKQELQDEMEFEEYDFSKLDINDEGWRWRQRREYLVSKILKVRAESVEHQEKQGTRTPKQDFSDQTSIAIAADTQTKASTESRRTTPCQEQQEAGLIDIEDIECREEELTGGDLTLIEKSLLEIKNGSTPRKSEEVALDIRPNKIQANNEMDENVDGKHDYVTVGVEDVKSVKRVRKLQGHMDAVLSVQFDSKRCLTGSADRVLRMWDIRSGRGIRKMLGHSGGVRCAQFDNEKIMSGSWDTTIMVWDTVKFNRLGILHGHKDCVSCLRFNARHVVSGSHDMTARVWDVHTWECLKVLEGHTGEITCLFLAGIFLITGSTDRTLKLWNIDTGQCLKTLVGHKSAVLSVQASRALVISGSEEGKIMFWDLESGECVAVVQGHDGPCNTLFLWKTHFLSGGGDHIVKQWDICTMTCLRTLQGHRGPVQCVKMSSRRIVSSSEDGTIRIWDLEMPVQQIDRQFDDCELNTLLIPLDTLEQNDDEDIPN